jgi:16S rRNA (cytosine967-C5)-methyltransferase
MYFSVFLVIEDTISFEQRLSTCSLLPDEGECQVEEALLRHPGLTADRAALDRPGIAPEWITEEGGLRLRPDYWPDLGGMDGFYMVCLQNG